MIESSIGPQAEQRDEAGNSITGVLDRAWRSTRHFRPVLILLVLLVAILGVLEDGFLTWANVQNILTASSVLWIVAIGMTFALLSGGVDLSVGALAALTGIFLAKVLESGLPGGVAVPLAILFGTLVGAGINGLLIGKLGLSFFVVTLATMTAFTGAVNLWSDTRSFSIDSSLVSALAIEDFLGLPAPIWIMAVTFAVALFVQRRTYFGRDIYAVGGSITAARLSGIRTSRVLLSVYTLVAFCTAIAAIVAVGRIGAASPMVEVALPLNAIAAVLIGGTSLFGGQGGVGGTALGVLFIGVLQNGLSIAGVPSFWQQVVTGVILIVAMFGDGMGNGRSLRSLLGRGRKTEAAVS